MIDDAIWNEPSDFRQLVSSDWTYTTPRLAEFYGPDWSAVDAESSDRLRASVRNAEVHVGVLTHPLVMANLSYFDSSSPIHRGVFLVRHVMGRTLRPPNTAFAPLSPDLHPDLSTRQRVELQTGAQSCQICHSKINALGFALESFDAAGRFRLTERGMPIDASGSYLTRQDQSVDFKGARELANFIVTSNDAHQAFVQRAFRYFVKQPIGAYGANRLEELTDQFRQSDFNVRELIIEIAVIAATQSIIDENVGT
jgi:hypothetical protein